MQRGVLPNSIPLLHPRQSWILLTSRLNSHPIRSPRFRFCSSRVWLGPHSSSRGLSRWQNRERRIADLLPVYGECLSASLQMVLQLAGFHLGLGGEGVPPRLTQRCASRRSEGDYLDIKAERRPSRRPPLGRWAAMATFDRSFARLLSSRACSESRRLQPLAQRAVGER